MESREYRNGLLAQGYAKLSEYLLLRERKRIAMSIGVRCNGGSAERWKGAAKNR